jgi:hypothetical protein
LIIFQFLLPALAGNAVLNGERFYIFENCAGFNEPFSKLPATI